MDRQLDVVLIHANAASKLYQDLSKDYSGIEPPLWCGMLASHVLTRGFSCAILDCEALRLTHGQGIEIVKEYNPRLVCFVSHGQQPNASSQNMQGCTEFAQLLRETYAKYPILIIGGYTSALPKKDVN